MRLTKDEIILKTIAVVFSILFALFALYPFLLMISASLTEVVSLARQGFKLIPARWSAVAYAYVFRSSAVLNAYGVTVFVTAVGTALSLLVTSAMAYPLSRKDLRFAPHVSFLVYLTMVFHAGLVAFYILVSRYLGLSNTVWALIIPSLVQPWNMFLLRNFFRLVPFEVIESAKIDGAKEYTVLLRLVVPLSLPAIATIGLFYALSYWNEWFRALLFISKESLQPLQYLMVRIMSSVSSVAQDHLEASGVSTQIQPAVPIRMATALVAAGPILIVYPFVQRYFVRGLVVGAIK